MSFSNDKSYLEVSDEALKQLKLLLAASPYEEPVIIFYFSNNRISNLGLPRALTESELDQVREIVHSPDFLASSTLYVDTAPGARYPDGSIVEIGGVPVNAPIAPAETVAPKKVRMIYEDGRFQLIDI